MKRGEKIGEVGNTAVADFEKEAHLHFEILIKDIVPSKEDLFYRNKITLQVNKNIGYFKEKTNSERNSISLIIL